MENQNMLFNQGKEKLLMNIKTDATYVRFLDMTDTELLEKAVQINPEVLYYISDVPSDIVKRELQRRPMSIRFLSPEGVDRETLRDALTSRDGATVWLFCSRIYGRVDWAAQFFPRAIRQAVESGMTAEMINAIVVGWSRGEVINQRKGIIPIKSVRIPFDELEITFDNREDKLLLDRMDIDNYLRTHTR